MEYHEWNVQVSRAEEGKFVSREGMDAVFAAFGGEHAAWTLRSQGG